MKTPQTPRLSVRKQPKQARSAGLVADILEAASRVLEREGARRFTTARVAEKAGVSIGSLYQYFPNKEAILFRLQTDEWQRTGDLLHAILADKTRSPHDRLRRLTLAFFRSECEEATLRVALGDAAAAFRDIPETHDQIKAGMRRVSLFMREAIPGLSKQERANAADLIKLALSSVGKSISEQGRSSAEVDRLAREMGDMFCAYLDQLIARSAEALKVRTARKTPNDRKATARK